MMEGVIQALAAPFDYLIEPSRRLYWLFLLASLALASLTVSLQSGRFQPLLQLRSLFNAQYWLNRSTAVDALMLFINSLCRLLLLVPLLGSHLSATILVGSLLQDTFGDAPRLALPWVVIGTLYTLVFFVCEDASRFALHFAMHKCPLLWRFHRLHHSASTLTPLTVHRVHPVEMSLYYLRGLVVFAVVSGVFVYLFRRQLHGWTILGVDTLGFLFNLFGANLRHSHIRLSFGGLERWVISPAQHQIHHSAAPAHRDKNLGTCLAVWDHLAKTWVRASSSQHLSFGLSGRK